MHLFRISSVKKCGWWDSNSQVGLYPQTVSETAQFTNFCTPAKSVRCYGTSRFDTDLQPIVWDLSSTNGPTAWSENSRCSPIHSYSPLLPMTTIKSHQTRCGGISQRKEHLLEQDVPCSVYISVVSTSTRRAHDRQPLVIRHLGV